MLVRIEDRSNGTIWIEASMVMEVYADTEWFQIWMNVWDHEDGAFRMYHVKDDPIPMLNEAKR